MQIVLSSMGPLIDLKARLIEIVVPWHPCDEQPSSVWSRLPVMGAGLQHPTINPISHGAFKYGPTIFQSIFVFSLYVYNESGEALLISVSVLLDRRYCRYTYVVIFNTAVWYSLAQAE